MAAIQEQIALRVTRFVQGLADKYPLRSAYIYGSWAEGRPGADSDIDIGIILEGEVGRSRRHELFALGKDFDPDFDVVALSEREFLFEDALVVHEIKTKGIRIA